MGSLSISWDFENQKCCVYFVFKFFRLRIVAETQHVSLLYSHSLLIHAPVSKKKKKRADDSLYILVKRLHLEIVDSSNIYISIHVVYGTQQQRILRLILERQRPVYLLPSLLDHVLYTVQSHFMSCVKARSSTSLCWISYIQKRDDRNAGVAS